MEQLDWARCIDASFGDGPAAAGVDADLARGRRALTRRRTTWGTGVASVAAALAIAVPMAWLQSGDSTPVADSGGQTNSTQFGPTSAQTDPAPKSREEELEIAVGDLHGIRFVTATGTLQLPDGMILLGEADVPGRSGVKVFEVDLGSGKSLYLAFWADGTGLVQSSAEPGQLDRFATLLAGDAEREDLGAGR